eukprot:8310988-Pyramimonas_sp.AAC.1
MCAVAAGEPATPERWCCVTSGAKTFLDDVEYAGGPPPQSIQSRVTLDLHTREMVGNHGYADGRPAAADCLFPSDADSMDTVTYFHHSPQIARECGWSRTPTPRHGLAEGYAAVYESPCLHGVSGVLPCDMDRGFDSTAIAAAPGQSEDAGEGSGGVDLVDIDVPPILTMMMLRLRCQSQRLSDSRRARPPSRIYSITLRRTPVARHVTGQRL